MEGQDFDCGEEGIMQEAELLRVYGAVYRYLDGLNIYEVRNLARAFGVNAPTADKKHELIVRLIGVASGVSDPIPRSNKGARVKASEAAQERVDQVRRLIAECKEAAPFLESSLAEFHDRVPAAVRGGYCDLRCSGFLELGEKGGFLCNESGERTKIIVSEQCVSEYALREGDLLRGYACEKADGSAELVQVAECNGSAPLFAGRRSFEDIPALFPAERLPLKNSSSAVLRAMDLLCPIGKGQRVLFPAPSGAGKTLLLRLIAQCAEAAGMPIFFVSLDQRPEEGPEFLAAVSHAHVFCSPFDQSPIHQARVARLVLERCKRMAEMGEDVVLLLDSAEALVRACSASAALGEDPMRAVKHLFAAARRLEGGGSLTVVATADEGSALCAVLSGAANCLLVGSAELALRGIFPAVDLIRSFTKRAELLLRTDEREAAQKLREKIMKNSISDVLS